MELEKAFTSYKLAFVTAILLGIGMLSSASARVWYVKPDRTGDAPTIQSAIDSASVADTVLVAAGTYTDSVEVMIEGEARTTNIHLYKDISVIAEDLFHNTVLDFSENDCAVYIENTQSALLKGFRIYLYPDWGGWKPAKDFSVYCSSGCVIEFNYIEYNFYGSAIDIRDDSSDPKVIRNNVLRHNYAGVGVSAPNVTVEHNTIFSDTALEFGVGVWFAATSSGLLVQNNILIWGSRAVDCNNCDVSAFAIHCNAIYTTILDFAQQTSAIDLDPSNFELKPWGDPQFCGAAAGNFYLQADSPCAPGNHPNGYDCGFIGAYPVNCGTTPAEEKTWGSIKDRYR